jgi:hypothetical protein
MTEMICLRQADGKIIPLLSYKQGEAKTITCAPANDAQERLELHLYRHDPSKKQEPVEIGVFAMPLPALEKDAYSISLLFSIDDGGQLTVHGKLPDGSHQGMVFGKTPLVQSVSVQKRKPITLVLKTAASLVYAFFLFTLVAFLMCITFPEIASMIGIKF